MNGGPPPRGSLSWNNPRPCRCVRSGLSLTEYKLQPLFHQLHHHWESPTPSVLNSPPAGDKNTQSWWDNKHHWKILITCISYHFLDTTPGRRVNGWIPHTHGERTPQNHIPEMEPGPLFPASTVRKFPPTTPVLSILSFSTYPGGQDGKTGSRYFWSPISFGYKWSKYSSGNSKHFIFIFMNHCFILFARLSDVCWTWFLYSKFFF